MNNERKSEEGWNWMNAVSGFLAAGLLSLGLINLACGKLPKDIDFVPLLPLVSFCALVGAALGGGAHMRLLDHVPMLGDISKGVRWLIMALLIALAIALIVSSFQDPTVHSVPPGWELPD